ncbi:hypothetical protein D9613_003475 [Agrocybe pediades]|uniref:Uncharacterized protein n=1 Tax=Agrocybe pediades TaxID=84607 RepID=A0A8H4QQG7_9AGAR|nr:hypothetical protein D9613_003475 [Agrocybe pediades]
MAKLKLTFSSKASSTGTLPSPLTLEHDVRNKKEPRPSVKEYFSSIRSSRIFNLHNRPSSKIVSPGDTPPMRRSATQTRTPLLMSLFSSRQTRSLKSRHHRRYTVSLSQLGQTSSDPEVDVVDINQMLVPSGDPESPLDRAYKRRYNNAPAFTDPLTPESSPPRARDFTATSIENDVSFQSQSFDSGIGTSSLRSRPAQEEDLSSISLQPDHVLEVQDTNQRHQQVKKPIMMIPGDETHEIYRIAVILQNVARHICADQKHSQASVFRSLLPVVIFVYFFALGFIVPRVISHLGSWRAITSDMCFLTLGGLLLAVLALRTLIWTIGSIAQAFCDADLKELLRKSGLIVTNGGRVGQADLVAGIFA